MTDNWNNRQKIIDIKNNKKDSLIEKIDERNDSHIVQKKSIINTKPERKNDSFLDLFERMKALNSIERQENNNKKGDIIMERTTCIEVKGKNPSSIETKLDIIDEDKEKGIVKEMIERMEREDNSTLKLTNSKETLRKKLDIEKYIEKERDMIRKEKENDSLVNKEWTNNNPRNNDSLKEKIDERLKSIERSIIYPQNDSLAKLTKKIEILNSPLDIDRKRDITILNTTESSDNEKNDRH